MLNILSSVFKQTLKVLSKEYFSMVGILPAIVCNGMIYKLDVHLIEFHELVNLIYKFNQCVSEQTVWLNGMIEVDGTDHNSYYDYLHYAFE